MIKARIDKEHKFLKVDGGLTQVAAEATQIIDIIWQQNYEDDAAAAEDFRKAVTVVLTEPDSPMAWNAVASKEGAQDDQV